MAFNTDKRADKAGLKQVMRMACVMCQIAPIKADLYFFFHSLWGRRKRKPSESLKKKKCKEEKEQDRRKPFRKIDQLTAFMLNLLINILLLNYDLHLLEIWELNQAYCKGSHLLKYPPAATHMEKRGSSNKNKLIRRKHIQY